MKFPKQISNLIEAFERLPGIGPKSAERLTFYLLHVPKGEIDRMRDALSGISSGLTLCRDCKNISESAVCEVDEDQSRDRETICVVETPLDVFSFEKTKSFKGVYFVIHGLINPMNNIGPDELYINDLISRIKSDNEIKEVILALNPTMEGEATALYIKKRLDDLGREIVISRLGVGIPIGGDLQYADETTLSRAVSGRIALK
jgi:recombination protein RecR